MTAAKTKTSQPRLRQQYTCPDFAVAMRPPENDKERTVNVEVLASGESGKFSKRPTETRARIEVQYPDGFTIRLAACPTTGGYKVYEQRTGLCANRGLVRPPTSIQGAYNLFVAQLREANGAQELREALTEKMSTR